MSEGGGERPSYDFSGKVAVVTGAGRGIGRAYAEGLARAGAAVVVADIDDANAGQVAAELSASGMSAESVHLDVSSPESAEAMAAVAVGRFGGIDFLVNNAAIFGGMKLDFLLTVDWDYLDRFLAVNLKGALVCTRACYNAMAARGGGAIVNQSSTAAYLYAGYYGWAKAGINSLTQQLAHELGSMNIRINAIAPGPTDTEAARTVVPDNYMRELIGSLALKRQGRPDDLVGMCLFLLSEDARWVTGHVFNVDGGQVMRP
ncbi:MAG: SDR family oxidoreductase [Acidimicrobiales bacterium]